MFRTNPTLRSVAVLISLLTVCLVGAAVLRVNLSRPVVMGGKMPTARVEWSLPAAGVRYIGFSTSGDYVCTVSNDSEVACYGPKGEKRFLTKVPGADRAVVSPDGSFALAYSLRNPANSHLVFLDASGKVYWQMDAGDPVWSADAGGCEDGVCFVIGTGGRRVYVVTVGPGARRYRRWRVPGAACSVALDSTGTNVVTGTWQASSISSTSLDGHRDWDMEADPASLSYVQSLGDSDRLFARSIPNNSSVDGEAALMEPDGTILGRFPLDASQASRAIPSPDGVYVCIGYGKAIGHSGKTIVEKRAALYDYAGRKLWDKGSMLLPAVPVLVTRNGFVLISGGKNALLAVSPSGEIKQACALPAQMVSSVVSRDGSRALVMCADHRIYRLKTIQ